MPPVLYSAEQKKQKLSKIRVALEEVESLIQKMELEARSLQPNVKVVLLVKLREYKSNLKLNQAARDELLESGMAHSSMIWLLIFYHIDVYCILMRSS
nr:vesicle transport v-SNARE 13-like [Tanacetum cinerariifolium]GEY84221.1 vesicle transport v-SNARE 13-like [Tanacetum cinerariifolium]